MNKQKPRLFAFILTLCFFALVWMYVREFPLFSNTIGVGWLVLESMSVGLVAALVGIWQFRKRFMPWDRHLADIAFIVVTTVFFAPLFGSWFNRGLGLPASQTFEFVSETPYFAAGYGVLKGEKLTPTGYHLVVLENGVRRSFTYKTQAYFPITKPGESIILPVCKGLLGAKVMLL
jgi:drug/metabolite transporter (DMT)-like permease